MNRAGHTFPHGLAIKLGMIPCVMPTLFAVYLNKIALSAILRAEVYASAVSRTPGPVSVSVPWKIPLTFLFVKSEEEAHDGLLWEFGIPSSCGRDHGSIGC